MVNLVSLRLAAKSQVMEVDLKEFGTKSEPVSSLFLHYSEIYPHLN
jgi:hypothetical protein